MGTMLADLAVGVNAPQSAPPQAAVQLTPWLLLSFVTVAATPHCSLTVMAVGGVKADVKVTAMAGGLLCEPHAAKKMTVAVSVKTPARRRCELNIGELVNEV